MLTACDADVDRISTQLESDPDAVAVWATGSAATENVSSATLPAVAGKFGVTVYEAPVRSIVIASDATACTWLPAAERSGEFCATAATACASADTAGDGDTAAPTAASEAVSIAAVPAEIPAIVMESGCAVAVKFVMLSGTSVTEVAGLA